MPDITYVDAVMMREMVIAGAALLEKNRDAVNALNVFPVPDGDTGTNMSMTMISAVREMNGKELTTTSQAAAALAKGALRGARGNSGVILSQLFRGFAKSLDGVDKATPIQIADAFKVSADTAYKAVMKPKEGTILTVARVIAEHAVKQAQQQPTNHILHCNPSFDAAVPGATQSSCKVSISANSVSVTVWLRSSTS